jgi:uncharacterized protein YeaO (DUF488 family)
LEELLALLKDDLAKVDIARMNLLCTTGLPNAEKVDVDKYLATLDRWAEIIQSEEKKIRKHFEQDPAQFGNSLSKYKAVYLVLTIQEDLHCIHNKELARPGVLRDNRNLRFYKDSKDLFLHGLVEQGKGTCASIPVLAVTLGRRCGHPVWLVSGKEHLFVRWDDGKERFNFEASSQGTDFFADEHYHKWPFSSDEAEREREQWLKNLTPFEELHLFMQTRAMCLQANGSIDKAEEAHDAAVRGFPNSTAFQKNFTALRQACMIEQEGAKAKAAEPKPRVQKSWKSNPGPWRNCWPSRSRIWEKWTSPA